MDFGPNGERASDGNIIYPNASSITYGYDTSGNLTSERLSQYGLSYIKTYTWADGNLASESVWVRI